MSHTVRYPKTAPGVGWDRQEFSPALDPYPSQSAASLAAPAADGAGTQTDDHKDSVFNAWWDTLTPEQQDEVLVPVEPAPLPPLEGD